MRKIPPHIALNALESIQAHQRIIADETRLPKVRKRAETMLERLLARKEQFEEAAKGYDPRHRNRNAKRPIRNEKEDNTSQ